MSDDTTIPDSEQPSTELLTRLLELRAIDATSVSMPATQALRLLGPDTACEVIALRRENEVLRAQVAEHEDADRRWSADMEALRRELQAERAFIDTLIADLDARSGEPL